MSVKTKTPAGTIDMTPSWLDVCGIIETVFRDGNEEGRSKIRGELHRMATLADLYVAAQKAGRILPVTS